MGMGKTPGSDDENEGVFAEINITPLTDVMLVLLIIFMVTSTVIVQQGPGGGVKTGLKVNLPKGGAADVTARTTDLSVAVLADGRFVVSGNVVSQDELKKAFEQARGQNPDTVVIVQADEGVPHGTVVQVMELAKKAGLAQLAIGVREGE
ncbi:biopolymer transporter ExbD [Corallococcus sp. H22C18031201]|uniref:ExbD/TolR family protein n=1 Tax=Citreicoccus inhibens TaxID=2849499 RepID=UPI000E725C05|nr:biopolymer transporter ExbD [Citreicoccus inhibens]MBU8896592.1 biopolymer transporter ExbD [Citreicoccus inhibens]RJS18702.1 biopolymer transporter ExbD [Corallococcus sp. H22C18031201]